MNVRFVTSKEKKWQQELGYDLKKKKAKTATKNKISRNCNLAHFVLNRNALSPKIYTAVSDHDTFYQNVCLHLTSTPREANESLVTNFCFLLTISIQEKGYGNHQNDHQRENAWIFYQFLVTNSLRKYTEIGLENMSLDTGVKGSKASCAGFLPREFFFFPLFFAQALLHLYQ